MLDFDEAVTGTDKNIVGKKMKLKEGKYLYSFRDAWLAGKEESSMIIRSKKKENFDSRDYLSCEWPQ
jgi:hypothetical protein